MPEELKNSPPRQHSNLKWTFGLLFSFTLIINMVLFLLSKITSEDVAVPIATQLVAQQFSKEGLDESENVEEVRQKFLATGQERFYPFGEELDAYLTREEIRTLEARDLRLKLYDRLVGSVYYKKSKIDSEKFGVLAYFNHQTYNKLFNVYKITFIPLFLFLIGFVYFSYGLRRLINPALTLIFLNVLPVILFTLIKNTTPPPGDNGPLSILPRDTMLEVIKPISKTFNIYFLTGVGLLFVAVIIKIFQNTIKTRTKI